MKKILTSKIVLLVLAISSITLFNSCDKDKCKGVTCPAGQICQEGECIGNPSGEGEEQVSGFITTNTTWTADKIWILNGRVVVRSGATLTIEKGTLVKGANGSGTSASVLIVERGAKINAVGTADEPIIFTSVDDNITFGEKAGTNLTEVDNELWGGLIILGNAKVSTADGDTQGQIEGIPSNETYGVYGGSNDADNSGRLEYISIRHGGITIGDGNEINGLTLGGVGNGTTIENVEVVANLDDGIEFFGGSVDVTNAIVVYQGDDGIDIDQNYSGTVNNVMVITGDGIGTDEALEIDGPEGSTYTGGKFTISNGTFITEGTEGSGADLKAKAQGNITLCSWEGFSKFVKVRASFSDTLLCTAKDDSYVYMTQTSPNLTIFNSEIVSTGSLTDLANAYNGSGGNCLGASEEADLDMAISGSSNAVVGAATKGADKTKFANWTWASIKNKL